MLAVCAISMKLINILRLETALKITKNESKMAANVVGQITLKKKKKKFTMLI